MKADDSEGSVYFPFFFTTAAAPLGDALLFPHPFRVFPELIRSAVDGTVRILKSALKNGEGSIGSSCESAFFLVRVRFIFVPSR